MQMINKYKEIIAEGYEYVKWLRKKYGKNTEIFLAMFPGTGDIYYSCRYLESYVRREGYKSFCMLVIGGGCKRVMELFPNIPCEEISKQKAASIEYYRIFREDDKVHLLHHDLPVFREPFMIGKKIRGYKGIHFLDLLYKSAFDDVSDLELQQPVFQEEKAMNYLKENNIKQGSIVISPYAKSMTDIPKIFWETLVQMLNDKGKTVYTNCAIGEEPIKGSVGLYFEFVISKPVLDYCGTYIGLRSGFTDIISTAICKKIVLYPKKFRKGCGNSLDCYSLKKMCDDFSAIELEYDEDLMKDSEDECIAMAGRVYERII